MSPWGTILRAATDAYVAGVGTRSLGGRIVTLAEEREVQVIGVLEECARVVMEDGIPALVSPEQLR